MNIELYGLRQPALILPINTGLCYINQTAGTACISRIARGALQPVESYVVDGLRERLLGKISLTTEDAHKKHGLM